MPTWLKMLSPHFTFTPLFNTESKTKQNSIARVTSYTLIIYYLGHWTSETNQGTNNKKVINNNPTICE